MGHAVRYASHALDGEAGSAPRTPVARIDGTPRTGRQPGPVRRRAGASFPVVRCLSAEHRPEAGRATSDASRLQRNL